MWYFAWILGLGLALLFGVLNAMWFELRAADRDRANSKR
jgi:cyd operon protein YbgT